MSSSVSLKRYTDTSTLIVQLRIFEKVYRQAHEPENAEQFDDVEKDQEHNLTSLSVGLFLFVRKVLHDRHELGRVERTRLVHIVFCGHSAKVIRDFIHANRPVRTQQLAQLLRFQAPVPIQVVGLGRFTEGRGQLVEGDPGLFQARGEEFRGKNTRAGLLGAGGGIWAGSPSGPGRGIPRKKHPRRTAGSWGRNMGGVVYGRSLWAVFMGGFVGTIIWWWSSGLTMYVSCVGDERRPDQSSWNLLSSGSFLVSAGPGAVSDFLVPEP